MCAGVSNLAALRAAIFKLFAQNRWGVGQNLPPPLQCACYRALGGTVSCLVSSHSLTYPYSSLRINGRGMVVMTHDLPEFYPPLNFSCKSNPVHNTDQVYESSQYIDAWHMVSKHLVLKVKVLLVHLNLTRDRTDFRPLHFFFKLYNWGKSRLG